MLKNLLQVLIGLISSMVSMFCWRRLLGSWSTLITTMLLAGAAAQLRNPDTFYSGIGIMIGLAVPFVIVHAKTVYAWAVDQWRGYSKDAEGHVIIDAIGVVVH